ncbi:6-bladed beta-propeller [Nitrosopumilus sp.]|uniref:6-bladed beta-propeller n=1 Tax=Nitrosopumilus sp. TaxID=2024843 RepID=UPI003D0B5841
MKTIPVAVAIITAILLSGTFAPYSYALGDYDFLASWGEFGISTPGHLSHPQFIAVDAEGNSYVSDLGNKRIQKFSSSGEFILNFGESGKSSGQFHHPSGVAVDSDFVYVADQNLHKIQKFTLDGIFVDEWGKYGNQDGQLKSPKDIAVDSDYLYVVDSDNYRIQKFTTDGEFVLSFGSGGMNHDQFLVLSGIAVDKDGNIYITDKGNRKIEKFTPDGILIKSYPLFGINYVFAPTGITVDSDGKIFVINSAENKVLYLELDDNLRLNIFEQLGPFGNSFVAPTDVAFGFQGNLLIVDSAAHKVKSFETPFYDETKVFQTTEIIVPEVTEGYESDDIDPTIMAPSDIKLEATDLLTPVPIGDAVANDLQSGIKTILNNAPEAFSLGVNKVTWIAFDNAGNTAEDYQNITVFACGHAYSDYNMIVGTDENDVLLGTSSDDLIFGLEGNDIISGLEGNDCIFGGEGDDIVYGNDGYDTISGNGGHDVLKGDSGSDVIYGGSGSDVLDGGSESDNCYDSLENVVLNCNE